MRCFYLSLFLTSAAISVCSAWPALAMPLHYRALEEIFGEPVSLSATGTPLRASDVVANMTIITQEDIRRSASRSLPEIINRHVAGFHLLQTGRSGYDLGVRGYQRSNQPRLLVLIDGRQVFIDDFSRTLWPGLPVNVDDIRQIEVVKGPASALFGSNAVGGVVNIITSNPLYDDVSLASISLGTDGFISGDSTVSLNQKRLYGVKLSAGGSNADEYNTARYGNEESITLAPRNRYLSGRGHYALSPKLILNSSFSYAQGQDTQTTFTQTLFGEKYVTFSAEGGWSWNSPYGTITHTNYFNRAVVPTISSQYPIASTLKTDLFVSQLEDQIKINQAHTVSFGTEYRFKKYTHEHDQLPVNPQKPYILQNNFVAKGTWHWTLGDQLSWTNALRLDHFMMRHIGEIATSDPARKSDYSRAYNALSANTGLIYKPSALDTFRVSYGRGIQMPSMMQMGWTLTMARSSYYVDLVGNPFLKPSITQNYEIGYERKIDPLFSKLGFSVYYQLNQDVAGVAIIPGFFIHNGVPMVQAKTVNVGNSHGHGAEVTFNGRHPSGIKWESSYSWSRIADSEGVAALINYRGSAPVHQFRLGLGYATGKWEVDALGHYVTDTDMLRRIGFTSYRMPTNAYTTVEGRIGYQIADAFSIALSGTQLNQARMETSPYPAIERQIFCTFSGRF